MSPTRVENLSLDQVIPHPKNIRRDVGDVTDLAESIAAKGILQPLVVAPTDDGTFVLIAGHRRLAAAQVACLPDVPAVIREDLADDASQIEAMLVENVHRADLTVTEEGDAYTQLLAFDGYDVKQLAAKTGRAAKTIRDRVAVAALPDKARDRLDTGQLKLEDALALAEFDYDHELQSRLLAAVGTYNFSWELQRARQARAAEKNKAKHTKALKKAGVQIIDVADLPDDWCDLESLADELVEESTLEALGDDHEAFEKAVIDAHTDCPGHAATWNADGTPAYICTAPDRHDDTSTAKPADAADPAAQKAAAAAEAEAERLREGLAAATAARLEHLRGVISNPPAGAATDPLRAEIAKSLSASTWGWNHRRPVWGIPADATDEQVEKALGGLSLEQLVVGRRIADGVARADHYLQDAAGTTYWRARWTEEWRDELENTWGYVWSDFERSLLDPPKDEG
ncbi:ParB/RepB/Spo0J family partition protein [Thalassiella azotivora]